MLTNAKIYQVSPFRGPWQNESRSALKELGTKSGESEWCEAALHFCPDDVFRGEESAWNGGYEAEIQGERPVGK